jgi:hypothetical protein
MRQNFKDLPYRRKYRQYRSFNAVGTQLTVRPQPLHEGEDSNPMSHSLASVPDRFEYALQNCDVSDMVGLK